MNKLGTVVLTTCRFMNSVRLLVEFSIIIVHFNVGPMMYERIEYFEQKCICPLVSTPLHGINSGGWARLRGTPRFVLTLSLLKSFSVLKFRQRFPNCSSLLMFTTALLSLLSAQFPRMALPLILIFFFLLWRCDPTRVMSSSFLRFLDHTQRRTTVGRTPLDE